MITLNGTDLETIGLLAHVRRLPRLHGEQSRMLAIPGMIGGVRAGGQQPVESLVIEATLTAADHAELLTRMDTLAALCRGEVVIRISDITDREWVGYLDASSQFNPGPISWIAEFEPLTLVFNCPDPTARGQAETSHVGVNPTLELGNAPSRLTVSVQNGVGAAITEIVVAVRAGTTVLRELEWVGSVGSGDLWEVTTDPAFEVTVDGVNAIDGLTDVSEFPIADSAEGATNVLVTYVGGATPVVTTSYRKRW